MFKYIFFIFAWFLLLSNNILLLFFSLISITIFLKFNIKDFSYKSFFEKLDKLSIFCFTIFISYIFIALFRKSENLFFIYLEDALLIILKIIDLILINFFIKDFNLKKLIKNQTIVKIFNLFPVLESILFEELNTYPGKIDKLLNIDKIVVNFIYKSIIFSRKV